MMKNTMKKIMAICLVASIAAVTFGCSSGKQDSITVETITPEDAKQELQFFYESGGGEDATEEAVQETKDPVEPATEIVTEIVTEYVEVTDPQGEPVTEADGVVQTEVHTEIATSIVTEPQENSTEAPKTHTPSYDTCKAYWFDMSQQADFTFNGEFLVIEFQINENTPAGSYPITITEPDFGSWELVTRYPELVAGEIVVGDGEPAAQPAPSDAFTLTAKSVSGNPGDTVKLVIDLANNPGFCAFVVDIQYDTAALTIVDAYEGEAFGGAINYLT